MVAALLARRRWCRLSKESRTRRDLSTMRRNSPPRIEVTSQYGLAQLTLLVRRCFRSSSELSPKPSPAKTSPSGSSSTPARVTSRKSP